MCAPCAERKGKGRSDFVFNCLLLFISVHVNILFSFLTHRCRILSLTLNMTHFSSIYQK